MLLATRPRSWLAIGVIVLIVACNLASPTPKPAVPTPSPAPATPTITPIPNTPAPAVTVKLILRQPPGDSRNGGVEALAFSPDGRRLASLHKSGKIFLWDTGSEQIIRSFPGGGETGGLGTMPGFAFSPDGLSLVSRANGRAPVIWDVATGQSLEVESGLSQANGLALSPDGKLLAFGKCAELSASSVCSRYDIVLWDMIARQPAGEPFGFDVGASAPLGLLFSPDGKSLAVMSSGTTGSGRVELFDTATRRSIAAPLAGEEQFSSMAFSPESDYMILGTLGGVIYFWNVQARKVVAQMADEKGIVTNIILSPDGNIVAARLLVPSSEAMPHEKIVLWYGVRTVGPSLIGQVATGKDTGFISTAFSPDCSTLASGTEDGMIALWDLGPGSHCP